MRLIRYIIQKEFLQIVRDKAMMGMIFMVPMLQLLVLINAADFSIKNIRFHIVDHCSSPFSRALIAKFDATPYFIVDGISHSESAASQRLLHDESDAVLVLPSDLETAFYAGTSSEALLQVNGIDGQAAGLISKYTAELLQQYNAQVIEGMTGQKRANNDVASVRFWYNPSMNYKYFMLPGLLAVLVTMIGFFLAAMNIVKEKEIGTIEQLNVTPISKGQFIIGKLFPFWCIGLFEMGFGLFLGWLIYGIPLEGSLLLLFAFTAVYLLVVLGFGLFMSTLAETQQQAMFLSFFVIIIFILMSGLFTAVENMPTWAQRLTLLNPVAWLVKVIRAILLKGSSFADLWTSFAAISGYAFVMLSLATLNYKKRS